MSAYLFVHFKEKTSPDGEQVYFGISKDGMHWESVNQGYPVLWAYFGDNGVRDHTITYCRYTRQYVILSTDLSLAYGMRGKYLHSWDEISRNGSPYLSRWTSPDLVNWSEQKLVRVADENFGCVWAPDIIFDESTGDYVVHWSSAHIEDNYQTKKIWCAHTRDFETFTAPEVLYARPDGDRVIDSALYQDNGKYALFVKYECSNAGIELLEADKLIGPYTPVKGFRESIALAQENMYEAPTAVKLDDGRWCLFLDYYGVKGSGQGYVPFLGNSLLKGDFVRAESDFSFPYRFKHGTVLTITDEEYARIKAHTWEEPDRR